MFEKCQGAFDIFRTISHTIKDLKILREKMYLMCQCERRQEGIDRPSLEAFFDLRRYLMPR
jgi:hypothetical protein